MHYLDEFSSFDEVDGIFTVLLNACANGEDIWIKDDVIGFKAHFGNQQLIGSSADLHFTVGVRSLDDSTQEICVCKYCQSVDSPRATVTYSHIVF